MTEDEIAALRERLAERLAEIEGLQAISADSRSAVELDQSSVGRLSRVDAMQSQQLALATQRQRQTEISRIQAALARLDDGSYGYCIVCDEEIEPKRLALDAATPTCISCASARPGT